jgi:hypothetical protein
MLISGLLVYRIDVQEKAKCATIVHLSTTAGSIPENVATVKHAVKFIANHEPDISEIQV